MSQSDLIIVGASARAAAFSALRAGLRPYSIDLFADCDLTDMCPAVKISRYPQDSEAALAAAPQAPWIYSGGLENYPDLVERMAKLRPLYGNEAEVLRRIRCHELLAACLAESDFPMPECRDEPPSVSPHEWLRKPRGSSGGLGIRRLRDAVGGRRGSQYYFQRFISGISRSGVYLATSGGDCSLLGVTELQSGAAEFPQEPFLYAGSRTCFVSEKHDAQLTDIGRILTQNFGLRGLFNLDFIDDGSRIWPLEVNPRYSASIEVLEYSQGRSFLALHMAEFEGNSREVSSSSISGSVQQVAKRVVYAEHDCLVQPQLHELRRTWNVNPLRPVLADIPPVESRLLRGQPVVTVIAQGDSGEAVQRILNERVRQVKQSLSPA